MHTDDIVNIIIIVVVVLYIDLEFSVIQWPSSVIQLLPLPSFVIDGTKVNTEVLCMVLGSEQQDQELKPCPRPQHSAAEVNPALFSGLCQVSHSSSGPQQDFYLGESLYCICLSNRRYFFLHMQNIQVYLRELHLKLNYEDKKFNLSAPTNWLFFLKCLKCFPYTKQLKLWIALNPAPVILAEFHFTGYK